MIPYRFADGRPFREGLAAVVSMAIAISKRARVQAEAHRPSVRPESDCGGVPFDVKKRCGEGVIDKTGKVGLRFQGVRDFSEGLAAVEKDGKVGSSAPMGSFPCNRASRAARSFHGS